MGRHRYVPVARLPRHRAFVEIMKKYTTAYRVNDDPVWRDAPILQVRVMSTIVLTNWNGSWNKERITQTNYPHPINGEQEKASKMTITTIENNRIESFDVDGYVAPKFHDKFDISRHINVNKLRANKLFLSMLERFWQSTDHVMVLDSPAGHTVQHLSRMIPSAQLHVANPNTSVDQRLFRLAQWHAATALEFIRDYPRNVPTHYWLDYCCTFDGCVSQTVPKLDIEAIFCRGDLPRVGGVICLTFSLRCYKKSGLERQVRLFMHKVAKRYGYKVHLFDSVFSYNQISFFRFVTI